MGIRAKGWRRPAAIAAGCFAALTAVGVATSAAHTKASATGFGLPDTCLDGYVWREAGPSDHVCVTSGGRDRAADDNAQGAARRNPNGGDYGPDTCLDGFIWRGAFDGDHVCVPPIRYDQVQAENNKGGARRTVEFYDSGVVKGLRALRGPTGRTIDGSARVQLSPNGAFTFTGHFESLATLKRTVTTTCVVKLHDGRGLSFTAKGDINGVINVFKSQNLDWRQTGISAEIYNNWTGISANTHTTCAAGTDIPVGDMIARTKEIAGVVGEVISIFAG